MQNSLFYRALLQKSLMIKLCRLCWGRRGKIRILAEYSRYFYTQRVRRVLMMYLESSLVSFTKEPYKRDEVPPSLHVPWVYLVCLRESTLEIANKVFRDLSPWHHWCARVSRWARQKTPRPALSKRKIWLACLNWKYYSPMLALTTHANSERRFVLRWARTPCAVVCTWVIVHRCAVDAQEHNQPRPCLYAWHQAPNANGSLGR